MSVPRPPRALVDRFRADLTALGIDEPFAVAVSGGPDSLALLLLAATAFPRLVQAATVDHGLRPESADETSLVAEICRRLGVPHEILRIDVDTSRASLQRAARESRYAALDAWMDRRSLRVLATAHHADDQAETLLMRLLRGSGVAGLSGVRANSPLPVRGSERIVIRPLLGWRREELRAIVAAAGITPVDDPGNRDLGFDRVRIRQKLRENPWLDPEALARSAAAVAEAEDALVWATQRVWDEQVRSAGDEIHFQPDSAPPELKRRILLRILEALNDQTPTPRGEAIGRLLETLAANGTATLAGIQCRGGRVWHFRRAPARRQRG